MLKKIFLCCVFASYLEACELNPDLIYFAPAQQQDRALLTELAIDSTDVHNKRLAPKFVARLIFTITSEQIAAGLVEKILQSNCSEILGFYALRTNPQDHAQQKIELRLLFVNPSYIKHGLGSRLFQRAQAHSQALGYKNLYWISDPDAQDFYRKQGALQTGTSFNILNFFTPVVLFSKPIS